MAVRPDHLNDCDVRDGAERSDDIAALASAADQLFAVMRRARSKEVGPGELSLSQAELLEPLLEAEALPGSRLAAVAGISHPTATRLLKRLEAEEVITRKRSRNDERVVLVALTRKGREQLCALRSRVRANQVRTLGRLSPAQRATLTAQLRLLADVMVDDGIGDITPSHP